MRRTDRVLGSILVPILLPFLVPRPCLLKDAKWNMGTRMAGPKLIGFCWTSMRSNEDRDGFISLFVSLLDIVYRFLSSQA